MISARAFSVCLGGVSALAVSCGAGEAQPVHVAPALPAAPSGSSGASTMPSAGARAEAPVAIALDVDVFGPNGGRPIAHVARGEVLTRSANLTRMAAQTRTGILEGPLMRIRTPEGVVEGYTELTYGRPHRGVGLFASRDVIVTTEAGVPVGALARGAFVPVTRIATNATTANVQLAPFPIEGVVPFDALGLAADQSALRGVAHPALADVVDNRMIYLETAAGRITTGCEAPAAIGPTVASGVEVAQTIEGVTVRGYTREPAGRCPPRVVRAGAAVRPGYVAVTAAPITMLAAPRDFYRIDTRADPPACIPWTFRPGPRPTVVATQREKPMWADGVLVSVTTYAMRGISAKMRFPAGIELESIASTTRDEKGKRPRGYGEGWSGSVWRFDAVAESPEGLQLLDGVTDDPATASPAPIAAYHPDDVELWFVRRDACERALERAGHDLRARLLSR